MPEPSTEPIHCDAPIRHHPHQHALVTSFNPGKALNSRGRLRRRRFTAVSRRCFTEKPLHSQ
jgi:hypothetical protein